MEAELKNHAEEKNLLFLSSAFSKDAVDLLEELGMKYWKIASGQIFDEIVLKKILQTKKTPSIEYRDVFIQRSR